MASKDPARRKEIAAMGARARNARYGKTPGSWRKGDPKLVDLGRRNHQAAISKNPDYQSDAGKRSRLYENQIAEQLGREYEFVFLPYQVCDRICIKAGRIYFVEIKKNDKMRLTEMQQRFQSLVPEGYVVVQGKF